MTVEQEHKKLAALLAWAKANPALAEQLALDGSRLLGWAGHRSEQAKKPGFLQRCLARFGEADTPADFDQIRALALAWLEQMLEEGLLAPHLLLVLRNNLGALVCDQESGAGARNLAEALQANLAAIGEDGIRLAARELAERMQAGFESLECRADQLEISANLQGWLLGLEERDYDEKIPDPWLRLMRICSDFYQLKKDAWNHNDLLFLRKALRIAGLDPKQKISLNALLARLVAASGASEAGFDAYATALAQFAPKDCGDYCRHALANVSSPLLTVLHELERHYRDGLELVDELSAALDIPEAEALQRLIGRSFKNFNIDPDYEFRLVDIALALIASWSLLARLAEPEQAAQTSVQAPDPQEPDYAKLAEYKISDAHKITLGPWQTAARKFSFSDKERLDSITFIDGSFYFIADDGVWTTRDFESFEQIRDYPELYVLCALNDRLVSYSRTDLSVYGGDGLWERPPIATVLRERALSCWNLVPFAGTIFLFAAQAAELSAAELHNKENLLFCGKSLDKLAPCPVPIKLTGRSYFLSSSDTLLLINSELRGKKADLTVFVSADGERWFGLELPLAKAGQIVEVLCIGNSFYCLIDESGHYALQPLLLAKGANGSQLHELARQFAYELPFGDNSPAHGIAIGYNEQGQGCIKGLWLADNHGRVASLGELPAPPAGICYNGRQLVVSLRNGSLMRRELY